MGGSAATSLTPKARAEWEYRVIGIDAADPTLRPGVFITADSVEDMYAHLLPFAAAHGLEMPGCTLDALGSPCFLELAATPVAFLRAAATAVYSQVRLAHRVLQSVRARYKRSLARGRDAVLRRGGQL